MPIYVGITVTSIEEKRVTIKRFDSTFPWYLLFLILGKVNL